jgi:hypothetical protein
VVKTGPASVARGGAAAWAGAVGGARGAALVADRVAAGGATGASGTVCPDGLTVLAAEADSGIDVFGDGAGWITWGATMGAGSTARVLVRACGSATAPREVVWSADGPGLFSPGVEHPAKTSAAAAHANQLLRCGIGASCTGHRPDSSANQASRIANILRQMTVFYFGFWVQGVIVAPCHSRR